MGQPTEPRTRFDWLPPVWVIGLLCFYLIAVDLTVNAADFFVGIPDVGVEVIALPILEEGLKLWLVLKLFDQAFSAIITFGVLELILVKVPILLTSQTNDELLILATLSMIPVLFHVSTALAYRTAARHRSLYVIFCVCVVLHILFNSLSLLDLHVSVLSLGAMLVCAAVVASGKLVALVSNSANRT